MAIFNGIYEWDGKKHDDLEPIAWFPGSYELIIYNFVHDDFPQIDFLKSHICLYSSTGKGQSISAYPEKFAKKICHDFSLEFERVLWVENLKKEESKDHNYEVVVYKKSGMVGENSFYNSEKRTPRRWELELIRLAITGSNRQEG